MVANHGSYSITTYIDKGKGEKKLSDFFIEEKYSRVKLKESNKIAKRLPVGISIIVIPSTLVKDILS